MGHHMVLFLSTIQHYFLIGIVIILVVQTSGIALWDYLMVGFMQKKIVTDFIFSFSICTSSYSSCVRSCLIHGSETWPVMRENDLSLLRAEMRMVHRHDRIAGEGRCVTPSP